MRVPALTQVKVPTVSPSYSGAMPEIAWLLDGEGRVREARAAADGPVGGDVLGRRCAELVAGRDEHGGEVCARCPVVARLRRGAYTAETTLVREGRTLRCCGTATPRGTEVRLSTETRPQADEVLRSLAWAVERMRDHARLFQTVRGFLGVLRRATGMEAAELFLVDPENRSVLLTSHHGRDARAFHSRATFRIGEGYPGIVASEGTALATHALPEDRRYLRSEVTGLGYCTFVSYPLHAPGGFVGVLDLASRDPGVPLQEANDLLAVVSPVLGAALRGALSDLSERGAEAASAGLRSGPAAGAASRVLELTGELTGARTVGMVSGPRAAGRPGRVSCPHIGDCPVWTGEPHGVGVAGIACPLEEHGEPRYCLPWQLGDEVAGVQSVVLGRAPRTPTQYLAPILWLQHRAGQLLGTAGPSGAAAEPVRVAVRTLGGFEIAIEGRLLDPRCMGRRKAWVLLKLLVARRGQVLTREEIAERLWPGDDPVPAVKRVHVLISTLRKAVERDPQAPALVLSEGDGYTFRPQEPCELDLETFERLLDEADRGEGPAAVRAYGEALRLYRGEFMAEEVYSDWFELDRAYYRERVATALERCAELQERQGRLGDAVLSLRHLLQIDPWRQPAYRSLARLLERRGDTAQAARVLRQGAELFAGEA